MSFGYETSSAAQSDMFIIVFMGRWVGRWMNGMAVGEPEPGSQSVSDRERRDIKSGH